MPCDIVPVKAFQSTNLNSKIETFTDVADRILRSLGAPLVRIETTDDMIFENISIAVEFFTKYAGYTHEYLAVHTSLYEHGRGIKMDVLATQYEQRQTGYFRRDLLFVSTSYVALDDIDKTVTDAIPSLMPLFPEGIKKADVVDVDKEEDGTFTVTYRGTRTEDVVFVTDSFLDEISQNDPTIEEKFTQSTEQNFSVDGTIATNATTKQLYKYFDYDLMNYRKAMAVINVEGTGDNLVFLSDNLNSVGALMAQPGMANSLGQFGFDLVSYYLLKDWMETRNKVLQTRVQWKFDERTQYLRLYPQPTSNYIALVECYIEKPIRDIVKEPWVQKYALALTKIQVAHVRGRFGNLSLFGGGTVNYSDLVSQGIKERDDLEEKLLSGASAGFGDAAPPRFFVR